MADASNPFPVLPQNQGDYYALQRQMAIAQALQQQAMAPQTDSEAGWNQMRIVPRATALSSVAKLGQALLAGYAGNKAIDAQRNFGNEQWQGMQSMFQPQQTAQYQNQPDASGNPQGVLTGGAMPTRTVTQQPSPMNPGNLNPQTAAMWYMRDPQGYMKEAVAPFITPTEQTKLAMQGGGSPQDIQAANRGAITKGNYIAPVDQRPGNMMNIPVPDGRGGVTYQKSYLPTLPQGSLPSYDSSGNVAGVTALPGAANVEQTMAGAKAMGAAGAKPITGYDANGLPVFTNEAQVASGGAGQSSGMFPGVTGLGSQAGALRPSAPIGFPDMVKDINERNQVVQQAAATAPQDIQAYREIDRLSQLAKTGVGFDRTAYLKSMASVIPGIGPNSNDKDVSDQMGKYVAQAAGRMGGRSDAALDNAVHSTTNSGMSPAAIHDLTPNLIGLKMADMGNANARQQWLQQHQNAPASLNEYESKWRAAYDPDAYRLQAMSPQQQQQFIQSLPAQRRAAILQSRQQLRALGAIPDMGQ